MKVSNDEHEINFVKNPTESTKNLIESPTAFIDGKTSYRIPNAEMFLGLDKDQKVIYFLTNRYYSNYSDSGNKKSISLADARFRYPPLVRKISFEQME